MDTQQCRKKTFDTLSNFWLRWSEAAFKSVCFEHVCMFQAFLWRVTVSLAWSCQTHMKCVCEPSESLARDGCSGYSKWFSQHALITSRWQITILLCCKSGHSDCHDPLSLHLNTAYTTLPMSYVFSDIHPVIIKVQGFIYGRPEEKAWLIPIFQCMGSQTKCPLLL